MSHFDEPNDQYRRPQSHQPDEMIDVRPTVDRRQLLTGSAMLLGLALLMILALVPLRADAPAAEPDAAQAHTAADQTLSAECAIIQHMTYTPCGHQMTRRQSLPAELSGKTRTDLAAAYDTWQVTAFSPTEVRMEQSLDMFCPDHVVLKPDESGMLCIWQNRYGDALALVKELGVAVGEMPDSVQDELRRGKGFDTREALEKWLESAES